MDRRNKHGTNEDGRSCYSTRRVAAFAAAERAAQRATAVSVTEHGFIVETSGRHTAANNGPAEQKPFVASRGFTPGSLPKRLNAYDRFAVALVVASIAAIAAWHFGLLQPVLANVGDALSMPRVVVLYLVAFLCAVAIRRRVAAGATDIPRSGISITVRKATLPVLAATK
jgi:hypothetical protein